MLCLWLAGCGPAALNDPAADKRSAAAERAQAARLRRACGSQDGYERLKAAAFAEAGRVRRANSPTLRRLASLSVVRVDKPVAVGRDEALGVTVCRGRLVIELPPGAEDAFDGDRRLEADIEYSAHEAADGSGLVYQIKGAEPIVYRLAAVDLHARQPTPEPEPTAVAVATVVPPPQSDPRPTARPSRRSPAEPTARAVAAKPRPAASPTPKARATRTARAAPARVRTKPTPNAAIARPVPKPKPTVSPKPRAAAVVRAAPVRARPKPRPTQVAARVATPAARPSFPCGYARSRVERLVCRDAGLARVDRAMSAEFSAALADADPYARRELRATRTRFLAYRDRCGSAECVRQAYADRIDEIRDIAAGE